MGSSHRAQALLAGILQGLDKKNKDQQVIDAGLRLEAIVIGTTLSDEGVRDVVIPRDGHTSRRLQLR